LNLAAKDENVNINKPELDNNKEEICYVTIQNTETGEIMVVDLRELTFIRREVPEDRPENKIK
jgi:hypothetical protein